MLIPFIGSGFTRGCEANKGFVPSGEEYREYMIDEISKKILLEQTEIDSLKSDTFSNVSSIYQSVIPNLEQRTYLKSNFTNVKIEDYKRKMLEICWPYIYTLNIDDGIENNSDYNHVVYSNRPVETGIFDDYLCVIKLHGDVAEMLTYKDSNSAILTQQQYLDSLKKNQQLLSKFSHDCIFQNIIFIGCSLDDEIDLLAHSNNGNIDTAKYICLTKKPSKLDTLKYEKYGITHCITFDSYEDIYKSLYNAGIEAQKITIDDLDKFKSFSVERLSSDYETNKSYLFFGKSLINKNHIISLPYFFITRNVTDEIFKKLSNNPIQFLVGSACSGKSYVLVDLSCRLKSRDVFLFETKDRLSGYAFKNLINKGNSVILADDSALSEEQIEHIITIQEELKNKNINIVIAVDKNNRTINGILKLHELQGDITINEIPRLQIKNKLNDTENENISRLLTACTVGIFKKDNTIIDNIIQLSVNLSEKNKYKNIMPKFGSVSEIAALIALATERKIYSTRAVKLELYDELYTQFKATKPLIEQESTWTFETNSDDNSPMKYVINAEYWLYYQLEEFAKKDNNYKLIVSAYKYIISRIIVQEGLPNLIYGNNKISYREYILFDNINRIFSSHRMSSQNGLKLIREIYENLNELLSADPNYMHQRAKCYIKSAYFEKESDKKIEYFDKAYRDANVAFQVFTNRYEEVGNEKILISASHVLYTKALILCHKCNIKHFENIEENTSAINMLYEALRSPYNSYEFAREDSFNYENVIKKIISMSITNKALVKPEVHSELSELFKIVSN